ncbi:hypothetical protein WJX84_004999 [Apatococcus fuscideae]|uniref:TRP C-terminal domain-containing protein n=1 Tax=Apatococcus fuscideae TaxID=2026836 RepID=A0AAW1TC19_9CHLO
MSLLELGGQRRALAEAPAASSVDNTVRQYIVTSMGVGDIVPGRNATTNPQSVTQQASLNLANGIMNSWGAQSNLYLRLARLAFWGTIIFLGVLLLHLALAAVIRRRKGRIPGPLAFPRLEGTLLLVGLPAIAAAVAVLAAGTTADIVVCVVLVALVPVGILCGLAALLTVWLFRPRSRRAAHVLSAWQLRKEYEGWRPPRVERWLWRPILGARAPNALWMDMESPNGRFLHRYGIFFEDTRGPLHLLRFATYKQDLKTKKYYRGRIEPMPNGSFLTARGRQMPGQEYLSPFAVLLHTLKLVAYAMLCLTITSGRSYAQIIALVVLAGVHLAYLRLYSPFLRRLDQVCEMVSAAADVAIFICALVVVGKDGVSDTARERLGSAMIALICISFAVFVLGRLWALGRHFNEQARDAALLWWRPTPAQKTAHAIEAVVAQNRRCLPRLARKYGDRWMFRVLGRQLPVPIHPNALPPGFGKPKFDKAPKPVVKPKPGIKSRASQAESQRGIPASPDDVDIASRSTATSGHTATSHSTGASETTISHGPSSPSSQIQGAVSICPISEPDFDSASKAGGGAPQVSRPRRGRIATHEILTHAYQLSFADALMDGHNDILQTPTPAFPSPFETAPLPHQGAAPASPSLRRTTSADSALREALTTPSPRPGRRHSNESRRSPALPQSGGLEDFLLTRISEQPGLQDSQDSSVGSPSWAARMSGLAGSARAGVAGLLPWIRTPPDRLPVVHQQQPCSSRESRWSPGDSTPQLASHRSAPTRQGSSALSRGDSADSQHRLAPGSPASPQAALRAPFSRRFRPQLAGSRTPEQGPGNFRYDSAGVTWSSDDIASAAQRSSTSHRRNLSGIFRTASWQSMSSAASSEI